MTRPCQVLFANCRFLPVPRVVVHGDAGLETVNPFREYPKGSRHASLSLILAMGKTLPVFQWWPEFEKYPGFVGTVPRDLYRPSATLEDVFVQSCAVCGTFFPSHSAAESHRKKLHPRQMGRSSEV